MSVCPYFLMVPRAVTPSLFRQIHVKPNRGTYARSRVLGAREVLMRHRVL